MSRGLTAAPRSGLVLFLADTGVTLRRKATTQNLPATQASPCSLFPPCPWQHPALPGFSRDARVSPSHEAVVGGEGGFGVSLETPVLFASGLGPVLGGTPRGNCFGRVLPPTSSSSPPSLMVSLKLEETKPPRFALSWDGLRKEDDAHTFVLASQSPPEW